MAMKFECMMLTIWCRAGRRFSRLRRGDVGMFMLLVFIGMMAAMATANGQGGRESDLVLYPRSEPLPLLLGPEVGYGWWDNAGTFTVTDGDRTCVAFGTSEGKGLTVGVKGVAYLTRWLFISPRVRREVRTSIATTPLPEESIRDAGNDVVQLQQEGRADVRITSTALDLTIGLEMFDLYVFGGGGLSLLGDGTFDYSERLLGPPGVIYNDSHTSTHTLIRNRKLEGYARSTFEVRAGGGYMLHLGPVVVNPEVFYSLPQESIVSLPSELKQTGLVATLSLMYNFGY